MSANVKTSSCSPTQTPAADSVDIPALKERYLQERRKRMQRDGQKQHIRPTGKLATYYEADPHKPVERRAPISEDIDATVTEQLGKQGRHIAHIISETMTRGAAAVEPSQEAQDAYVRRFEELQIDLSEFQALCPPSYFNNEGEDKPKWALFRSWGRGWNDFQQLLQDWRDKGDMNGLVLEQ